MIVIDSDIIIWLLRGRQDIAENFKKAVIERSGDIYVTPIQIAEIYAGILPKEETKVEKFFGAIRTVPLEEKAGKLAGEFMNKYGKSHNVTMADAMTAAVARLSNCALWTANKKHYPMLKKEEFYD